MTARRFVLYAFGVALFGLLLRELFVLLAIVPDPFEGDASAYMAYVRHIVHDGTFSMAYNADAVTPDAYRSPGYPLFLAAFVKPIGISGWYHYVVQGQILLGTATVALSIALAREYLPRGWALLVGGLMATQPHHIAASAFLLSEVLLAFVVTLALYATARALRGRSTGWALAGGVAFGAGFLINPILALFPSLLLFWRTREAVIVALVAVLFVGGWSVRNASIPESHANDRAYVNLVQGSYPLYHAAYNNRTLNPDAKAVSDVIDAEAAAMLRDPAAGLVTMRERMAREPAEYLRWYLGKPYLLWDWEVRIGAGGIYTQTVEMSPLDRIPILRAMSAIARGINPFLFALAAGFAALALWRRTAVLPALLFVYVTAIHTVLQAEPRYAIAYRSVEMLLAVGGLAWLTQWVASQSPIAKKPPLRVG